MRFSELAQKLGAEAPHHIAADPEITGVAAVEGAGAGSLSYIDGGRFAARVQTTAASGLILPKDAELQAQATDRGIAWIEAKDPRLMFAQAIALFYQPFRPPAEIHPTAVIASDARIGEGVAIGAHVVIQPGVTIGDGVCIHPNVVIYPDAVIGDRTVLHANCVIHERTMVGNDCVIHAGAVIGSEGFGFVPTREGWFKMEQSGHTVLEDGVEIGCNSTVDRPAVGETRIGRNTKLDNLVHIGHGCQVGQACAMAAQVGIAGGVKVGNRVILAGQVGVSNNTEIGDGAQAAAQAGVHGMLPAGQVVGGSPALPHRVYLKSSAIIARLPEMHKALKELQRRFGVE